MPDRDEYVLQTEAENAEVYSIARKHWCPSIEVGPEKMSRLEDELVSFVGVFVFIHERNENYASASRILVAVLGRHTGLSRVGRLGE